MTETFVIAGSYSQFKYLARSHGEHPTTGRFRYVRDEWWLCGRDRSTPVLTYGTWYDSHDAIRAHRAALAMGFKIDRAVEGSL